ncbi:MAG: ATP synthase subunit I [Cyanobacteria bacterium P01_F01_bin.150]
MNSPDNISEAASLSSEPQADESDSSLTLEENPSMVEYYQLQRELWITSLILMGVFFPAVWFWFSLNVALNYVIGATVGVWYLRLLGKKVETIGGQKSGLGNARFALIVGVIVIASRLQQLEILPIFLGFLTYKAAIIVYMLRSIVSPESN